MKVRIKNQKFNIEKVLMASKIEPIDEHAIEMAKKRVWNQLSVDSTSGMPDLLGSTHVPGLPTPTFWDRYHKSFLSLGIIVLVLLSTAGSFIYLGYKKGGGTNTYTANVTKIQNNSDLSNLKTLAASRFKALSGVTYEEFKSVLDTNVPINNSFSAEKGIAHNIAPTANSIPQNQSQGMQWINSSKAESLVKKMDQTDQKIYYTEQEIKAIDSQKSVFIINQYLGINSDQKHPSLDYSKPLILKSWYSTQFTKTTISQDGKLVIFNFIDNNESTSYLGGKYAVRDKFVNPIYFAGAVMTTSSGSVSPELSFLKYILDNSDTKELGNRTIDGKKLFVIELPTPSNGVMPEGGSESTKPLDGANSADKIVTRYYVDQSNFQLYITENYTNNQLSQTIKTISSQELKNDSSLEADKFKELANIEKKNVTHNAGYNNGPQYFKIADFAKFYSVYYYENLSNLLDSALDSNPEHLKEVDDTFRLTNTKDFNPLYSVDVNINSSDQSFSSASYAQSKLRFEIYDLEPKVDLKDSDLTVTTSDISINIDGKDVKAKFYEKKSSSKIIPPSDGAAPNSPESKDPVGTPASMGFLTRSIVFKSDDEKWYEISEFQDIETKNHLSKNGFKLKKLSSTEAEKIDKDIIEKSLSYPSLDSISLSSVSKDIRILPGDLKKNSLSATSLFKSSKKGSDSKCDNYYLESALIDCLVERYDGFKISFSQVGDIKPMQSTTPPSGYLYKNAQYLVLDVKLSVIRPILTKYGTDNIVSNQTYSAKEIKGKTIILWGNLESKDMDQLVSKSDIDLGYIEIEKQLSDSALKPDQNGGQTSPGSSGSLPSSPVESTPSISPTKKK